MEVVIVPLDVIGVGFPPLISPAVAMLVTVPPPETLPKVPSPKTTCALVPVHVKASVPVVVIGLPETDNAPLILAATLVTVPLPIAFNCNHLEGFVVGLSPLLVSIIHIYLPLFIFLGNRIPSYSLYGFVSL
jgi:hypothetical protein